MWWLLACVEPGIRGDKDLRSRPELGELLQVVPGEGLPAEVIPQAANNNLDVVRHEGRVWLAFRTAPNHFASEEARLYLMSSGDQAAWDLELEVHLGTDLREPRLLSHGGSLYFYWAVLGDNPAAFEPGSSMRAVRGPDGQWQGPELWRDDGFIPWRIRAREGRPMMVGYTGGEEVYDLPEGDLPQIEVHWLGSDDGLQWSGWAAEDPVIWRGGGSEADLAFAPDGAAVAVIRNEAGDAEGFGSLICRAEPGSLDQWSCAHDPRRYDSPLVFAHAGRIWLVARRNLTVDGAYDLGMDELDHRQQWLTYQAEYWGQPKRCSLWEVDPELLEVSWVLDLPSRGDTCFPSIIEEADGGYTLYNYSSDPEGAELSWLEGQTGPTQIYRQRLWLPD